MTIEQIKEFEEWHDSRLVELGYPPDIILELVSARMKWLSQIKVKK